MPALDRDRLFPHDCVAWYTQDAPLPDHAPTLVTPDRYVFHRLLFHSVLPEQLGITRKDLQRLKKATVRIFRTPVLTELAGVSLADGPVMQVQPQSPKTSRIGAPNMPAGLVHAPSSHSHNCSQRCPKDTR